MLLQSLKNGLGQTWRHRRMTLVFYLAQLACGLAVAVPLTVMVQRFAGRSLMGQRLEQGLDLDILASFIATNRSGLIMWGVLVGVVWGLGKLLVLFLSGGAIAGFVRGDRYDAQEFFQNSARHFGAFLRLTLWAIPVLFVLVFAQKLVGGFKTLIIGDARESVTYWMVAIRVGLGLLGLMLAGMIFDYARIHAVYHREARMHRSLIQGLLFALRNFPVAVGLTIILGVIGLVALWLFGLLYGLLDAPGLLLILWLFVFQQLYVLFRTFMKLFLWAGEARLYQLVQARD